MKGKSMVSVKERNVLIVVENLVGKFWKNFIKEVKLN